MTTWTTPPDWVTDAVPSADWLNSGIRDNLKFLHDAGGFIIRGAIAADGTTLTGSGFSSSFDGGHTYTITFATTMSNPIIMVTGYGANVAGGVFNQTTTGFQVILGAPGGGYAYAPWAFIALPA